MSKIYKEILAKTKASFTDAPFATCGEGLGVRFLIFLLVLASCSSQHHYQHSFQQNSNTGKNLLTNDVLTNDLLNDSALTHALVGVCVYDVESKKYIHQYNDEKYFVPASNTKLFTCYAAMKYLGDSLVGLRYETDEKNDETVILGTGDPTFLHSDFTNQPVLNFLNNKAKSKITYFDNGYHTRFSPLGSGWAWNDYEEPYMPERSELPMYGNCAKFYLLNDTLAVTPKPFYAHFTIYSSSRGFNGSRRFYSMNKNSAENHFRISRLLGEDTFKISMPSPELPLFSHQYIPYKTINNNLMPSLDRTFITLLADTLHKKVEMIPLMADISISLPNIIHSQPTDSLLKITMHRSDNFFAEQTLLMVSNEKLGYMSDEKIIDTLLKTDLKDLQQPPNWVDGSGLSRYNLFTPQDFVAILIKMKNEFGLSRIENILATGNTGTLAGLYKNLNGKIFAKTGTLGNQVALSGYLITKKGKWLIFSVLVNNHMNTAGNVRRAVEKFMNQVWERD
jgi:D-alanyl-D-alanine carboxypeptidase/D-alanyl-D-alanine-endopeptidase (penicillin-binding protein 4)